MKKFKLLTVSWKLFSSRFIIAVMTAHASSIAQNGRVTISNNLATVSVLVSYSSYASTNLVWKHLFASLQICLSFKLAGILEEMDNLGKSFLSIFLLWQHCQGEDSNTTLRELAWLKRHACFASTNLLSRKMETEYNFASKVFPAEKTQKLPLQIVSGGGRF